jgi:hypothetical protein
VLSRWAGTRACKAVAWLAGRQIALAWRRMANPGSAAAAALRRRTLRPAAVGDAPSHAAHARRLAHAAEGQAGPGRKVVAWSEPMPRARGQERGQGRWAARSTTCCWPASPAPSGSYLRAGRGPRRRARSAPWCR